MPFFEYQLTKGNLEFTHKTAIKNTVIRTHIIEAVIIQADKEKPVTIKGVNSIFVE